MATDCIAQVTFKGDGFEKPVVACFDVPYASSDGGAILLKGIDTQLGLTKRVVACLDDPRQPSKVQHQALELLRQRVFGLACGYADCNDAARVADDAIHKFLVDRDPITGPALASQPTLSRFENAVGWRELLAIGHVLADTVIEHLGLEEREQPGRREAPIEAHAKRGPGKGCVQLPKQAPQEPAGPAAGRRVAGPQHRGDGILLRLVAEGHHLPTSFPWLQTWRHLARAAGATT